MGALPLYVSEVVSRVLFHYRMLPGKGMRLPFVASESAIERRYQRRERPSSGCDDAGTFMID